MSLPSQARSDALVLQTEMAKSAEALVHVIAQIDAGSRGSYTRRTAMRSRRWATPVEAAAAQEEAALGCGALVLLLTQARLDDPMTY